MKNLNYVIATIVLLAVKMTAQAQTAEFSETAKTTINESAKELKEAKQKVKDAEKRAKKEEKHAKKKDV